MAERPPLSAFEDRPPLSSFEDAAPAKEGLGIMSLPSDVAELGARGIDWAAQKLGAEPREPQPFSFQRADPRNPEYAGIWKKAAEAAVSGATLPGDVYAGKVDPLSDEGIKRATELGTFASPMTPGSLTARAASPAIEEAVQAGARQGIAIPRFMTGETSVMPRVAESLRSAPIAGVPIESAGEAVRTGLTGAVERLAPETVPRVGGEAAKEGLTEAIKARPGVGEAYKGVENLLTNPAATTPLENVSNEVSKIMAERAASKIPGQSPAVKLFEDALADPQGMTYEGILGLRRHLGEMSPQELVAKGISKGEQKRLYGALTDDLRKSAEAAGGQPAVDAWEAANALARQNAQERRALYKIVGAKGDASPELVFNRLSAMAGRSSTADISRLALAKKTMGPEAWEQFTNSMISRLGRNTQGEFSPDRFMTAYSKIAPDARSIVFNPAQQRALNDIESVSKLVQDKASRFMNVSKTAHTAAGLAAVVGMILHPLTLLKEIGGGLAISYWLTRPAVVRAASNAGRASLTGNPAAQKRALLAFKAAVAADMERKRTPEGRWGEITNSMGFRKGGRVTKTFRYQEGGAVDPNAQQQQPPPENQGVKDFIAQQQAAFQPNYAGETWEGSTYDYARAAMQPGMSGYFDVSNGSIVPHQFTPREVADQAGVTTGQLASGFGPSGGYDSVGYNIPNDQGGFFNVGANSLPTVGSGLSTNNWRLLGMGPGYIMRQGNIINTRDPATRAGLPLGYDTSYSDTAESGAYIHRYVAPGAALTGRNKWDAYFWPGSSVTGYTRWPMGTNVARGGRINRARGGRLPLPSIHRGR